MEIDINVINVKNEVQTFRELKNTIKNHKMALDNITSSLSLSGVDKSTVKSVLTKISGNLEHIINSAKSMETALENTVNAYVQTENIIKGASVTTVLVGDIKAEVKTNSSDETTSSSWDAGTNHQDGKYEAYANGEASSSEFSESIEASYTNGDFGVNASAGVEGTSANASLNADAYAGKDGIGANASGELSANEGTISNSCSVNYGDAKLQASGELAIDSFETSASGEMHAGTESIGASGSAEITYSKYDGSANGFAGYEDLGITQDANIGIGTVTAGLSGVAVVNADGSSEIGASANASAAVASGDYNINIGTDDVNVHGNASGSVLGAGAEAKLGIRTNENHTGYAEASAGAEAYWAKAEVSGGVTIFGVDIDVTWEGLFGVQAEAGGKISSEGVEFNLGAGCEGVEVSINWADLDLPWD